jgi:CHASE3 domain sensor protein
MKYAQQTQDALDRLDASLRTLRNLIAKNQNREAIEYMENGDLKERFGELQNMIILSQVGNIGARGTQNSRPL